MDGEDNVMAYLSTNPGDDPARTEYHTNHFLLDPITDGVMTRLLTGPWYQGLP